MAVKTRLRIAILQADTPLDGTRKKYGDYGGVFTALLEAGANLIGFPKDDLVISKYEVVEKMEYPELESIDAILITGSRYDSFKSDLWITKLVEFTQKVLADGRVRIIGVCFGHQIVGRALGIKTGRSGKWEASVCNVDLTSKGEEIFGKKQLAIHQMHQDIVFAYPDHVERLGSSPKCENQGMLIPRQLITVQGHPEFNMEIVRELLETRHQQGIFDDETFQDGMNRVANHHDGIDIAGAFLKFLTDGR